MPLNIMVPRIHDLVKRATSSYAAGSLSADEEGVRDALDQLAAKIEQFLPRITDAPRRERVLAMQQRVQAAQRAMRRSWEQS